MQVVYFTAALQLIGAVSAGYSQYFYRAPLAAGYYQGDFHQPQYQPQIFAQPIPQFYQQPIFQTFGYQAAPLRVQENANVAPSRGNEPQQENTFNFVRKEADNFRGFAYHTEFDHGARSDVVFITGPEVHNLQTQLKQQNPHTTASDSIDSNAENSIEQLPMSIEALVNFIRNPEVGVRKFYSIDNALVARKSEDYLQYPANTIPLATPASPIYSVLRANFNAESKASKEETTQQASTPASTIYNVLRANFNAAAEEKTEVKEEQVVSASETKSNTVQLEVSSTEASTTEVSSSTEASTTEAASSSSSTTVEVTSTTTTESLKSTMGTIIVADEEDTPKKT